MKWNYHCPWADRALTVIEVITLAIALTALAVILVQTFGGANGTNSEKHQGNRFETNSSLVLEQVPSGEEPSIRSYAVPLSADLSSNRWILMLLDNGTPVNDRFERQTNNTYSVYWNTTRAASGTHSLQVCIAKPPSRKRILGPVRTEYITNLVHR